jgi:hypothetical protein
MRIPMEESADILGLVASDLAVEEPRLGIGSAPPRSPRRRNLSSCIACLDVVLYQDVKSKSDHHFARPHPSGDDFNLTRKVWQVHLSLSPGSQVPARALLPVDRLDQR